MQASICTCIPSHSSTSIATDTPRNALLGAGGYMVMVACTTKYVFDLHPGDRFWCTADCGWITGHSYLAYGPLLNGAANIIYEGVPVYPNPGRIWDIVDKLKVSHQLHPVTLKALNPKGFQSTSSSLPTWDIVNQLKGRSVICGERT